MPRPLHLDRGRSGTLPGDVARHETALEATGILAGPSESRAASRPVTALNRSRERIAAPIRVFAEFNDFFQNSLIQRPDPVSYPALVAARGVSAK